MGDVKISDFLGNRRAMHHLRSIAFFIAILIPTIFLLHSGYITTSEPFTIFNYQLILFLLPVAVFFTVVLRAWLAKIGYKSRRTKKKKQAFLRYQKMALEMGWPFWVYIGRIALGLVIPFFAIVGLVYLKPQHFKRRQLTRKALFLGFTLYPILFWVAYELLKAGVLYTLILFGPLSLLGLLKTLGDFVYYQMTFFSLKNMKKIGKKTFARMMHYPSLEKELVRNIRVLSRDSKHQLSADVNVYYDPRTGKKPAMEVSKLYFDDFPIDKTKDLDLSFFLSGLEPKAITFELVDSKPVTRNIGRWASICDFIYSVEIPKLEHVTLRIDGQELKLSRCFTHYVAVLPPETKQGQ